MTISPQPVSGERPTRTRYDWTSMRPGEWQNWLDLTGQDISDTDALKTATRVRLAATDYAKRHGLKLESRRLRYGRILDLRFTPRT